MPGSSYQSQCRALRLGVYAVILALIAYIGWLQLAENEEMNHWSERQQKRLNYVPGKRGAIVDRNGVPLNYDIATYDIAIHIEPVKVNGHYEAPCGEERVESKKESRE